MSTRCQMAVYESKNSPIESAEVLIYRHCDGYPGSMKKDDYGVIPVILPFLDRFHKERGIDDTSYCAARLIQHLGNENGAEGTTSLGVDGKDGFHGDIEYFYHISPECVQVFETPFDSQPSKWKKIKTFPIQQKVSK